MTYDLQGIELDIPSNTAFEFIRDPSQLPRWTEAFAATGEGSATMRTPAGEVEVVLDVLADAEQRTIDWRMTFPDDSVATAFSRVVPLAATRCVFTFVLTPPPGPLEDLEGTLAEQSQVLGRELRQLRRLLQGELD